MACVVKSRPAEFSSCRIAFSENPRAQYEREKVQGGRRKGREAR